MALEVKKWKEILNAIENDPKFSADKNKQACLERSLVTLLEDTIRGKHVSVITDLYKRFTQKPARSRVGDLNLKFLITREIYKKAFVSVSNGVSKFDVSKPNQSIGNEIGRIEPILAIASLIDNKLLIRKMLDLAEKGIKDNPEEQQVLLKSLINILTYSIANERLQTIQYICYERFSKASCPVVRETYIKAFADNKIAEELDEKIERQEKPAECEWWMELKKYLVKLNKCYEENTPIIKRACKKMPVDRGITRCSNQELNDLQKLKEIICEFIERSDYYNKLYQNGHHPALSYYKAEIDLKGLEQITRKFINNSGNISEKEVLQYNRLKIMLPGEKQLVENLRKLEKRISDFIQSVHNYEKLVLDGHYPALFQYPGEEDLMVLAQITRKLFLKKDDFEFIDKEELPSTCLEEIKEKSYIGGILSWWPFKNVELTI